MTGKSKAHRAFIAAAAASLLVERGVDVTEQVTIYPLAQELAQRTGCHFDTARRHIAQQVRLRRGELTAAWGGERPGSGRPKQETMD